MLTLKIGFNVFSVIQITDQLGATVSIGDSERWYSNIQIQVGKMYMFDVLDKIDIVTDTPIGYQFVAEVTKNYDFLLEAVFVPNTLFGIDQVEKNSGKSLFAFKGVYRYTDYSGVNVFGGLEIGDGLAYYGLMTWKPYSLKAYLGS